MEGRDQRRSWKNWLAGQDDLVQELGAWMWEAGMAGQGNETVPEV